MYLDRSYRPLTATAVAMANVPNTSICLMSGSVPYTFRPYIGEALGLHPRYAMYGLKEKVCITPVA
jgi:hypothetical protein